MAGMVRKQSRPIGWHLPALLAATLLSLASVPHLANAQDRDEKKPVATRVDLYGDPLPAGAIARCGTVRLHRGAQARCFALSDDGRRIATNGALPGTFDVWDVDSGKKLCTIKPSKSSPKSPLCSVAISSDGTRLANSVHGDVVRVYEVPSGKQLYSLPSATRQKYPVDLRFSFNGKVLAVGMTDIHLYNTGDGKLLRVLRPGHERVFHTPYFSRNDRLVFRLGKGTALTAWEVETGRLHSHLPDETEPSESEEQPPKGYPLRSMSPAAKVLALAYENALHVRDMQSGQRLLTLARQGCVLSPACLSPDEKAVALQTHDDNTIHLLEVPSGKQLAVLTGHQSKPLFFCRFPATASVWPQRPGTVFTPGTWKKRRPFIVHRDIPRWSCRSGFLPIAS